MLENQVKAYHPYFHNQLFGGFDEHAYIGAVMAPSINGAVHTYEVAQCFIELEKDFYEHMRKRVGWETADGTITPGGSFANFLGIHLARGRIEPDFNQNGLFGCKPFKILTSEVCHYSFQKGANLCGIGTKNVISVKTDEHRRMIPS